MAISDKKLRQVYSTLQKGGYSEDYDTFMRGFAGNENYQNRKNVYDLLKGAGADIGDTYEDFIGNLQSDNKGSGNYVYNPDGISPAEEKKEEVQPVINVENTEDDGVDDATFADYMRGIQAGMRQTQTAIDRTNKAVEYGQKNLGPNVKPAKLDIADNRNVMEEEVYNPETMQMETKYTTSYGDTYQDKFSAKQEQDKIDLKNRFDSLQRGIEKERQSVYAEVDAEIEKLQKQIATLNAMKKDGEPKQAEGYRQQAISDLENKIADLQEKRGEFDKEAEFRANKFLYENSGMKEQVEESLKQANEAVYEMNEDDKVRQAIDAVQRNSPFLVLRGAAAGAENLYDLVKRWSNPEYGKSVATQRKLSDASKDTELALGKDDGTWMTHLLRGAWDGATDIRTWDFGINDMTDMGRLYQLQAKADRIAQKELAGEESEEKLTASEQKMLDAIALSNTLEANFSDHVPMSYRVGQSVPESAGFAAAIAMNPASGLGKSIGKKAARRLIANGMTTMRYGKWGVKALSAGARVGGDALEALSTTLTTALPRTVEGVFEDMAGTAQGRYDEQGNLVFDKVTDMERNTMKAVGKGIYTNWMENQSEMVGEYFQPIGNFIRQATKNRAWMRNAVDVILGSDDAAKKSLIGKFRDRAKINGVFGEYTEEVYNNVMNAVPWGDMNMTGGVMRPNRADYKTEKEYEKAMDEWRGSVFNAETNVETFLSVTAMIFPMGAAELGGRYLNAYTTKAQLDVAIDNLNKTIGQEQASAIMNEMRNAESLQDMSKIYLTAMQDGRIKDGKQARALLDAVGRLVAYQSVNTSQANSTITEDKFERDYRNAYDAGHEMPIENKHKAGLEYESSMQELDRVLGDSFQGIAGMPFEQFQRLMQTLTPEQRSVAQEYYLQSARLAGMRDASMEEADKQVQMHYNTLRRVADKNGIVYRGSSLEEGEFISPESMRIPNSRMLVVLNADNPGASRVIAREEAGEITTSEMDEELRTMQEGLRLKAQNDYLWGVMHNPSTKMPQVGETIEYDEDGSGNGKRMRVIGFNDRGQVQLLPTYIDGETMEEKVSSGEPVVMSKYEALKRQDSYYDALEAEQSDTETEGQTVITPVTEGLTDSTAETSSQTGGLNDSNIETLSQTETSPENDATILTDEQRGVMDNWMNAEDDTNLVHARIDSVGDDVWSNDTKQAMHQYVDSVRRQQTETDSQQTQTTDSQQTQTTDSQQEQTTELPRDGKGNVLYHKAPIETTVADLMDGSLEDDEIDAFVEANITSAQKEVDKRTKDKPVMTTNKEKYLQEKAKWKENLTEAEGILAYWNTVKDAINEKRNAVTETETKTETEPMTEQTESVTESTTGQTESSNESVTESTTGKTGPSTDQTEGENAPVQTEVENAHAQTEGETESTSTQTEGGAETAPAQTEGGTESTQEQTEGVTESDKGNRKNPTKNKKRKKVKYDIYEFTGKDVKNKKGEIMRNPHPELNGVYHDDGYAIASDSRILVADKRAYDESKQGKVIGKDGSVIAEKYPGWKSIIPAQIRESDMDPYDILEFIADVKKKAREMKLRLSQCNVYFTAGGKVSCFVADNLDKFCRASIDLNASINFTNSKDDNRRLLFASSENGFALAMPAIIVVDDFEGADDFFHYEKEISLGNVVDNEVRASLRTEEENAENALEMQSVIVDPIDDTNAEVEIIPIEDMGTEEETQDIFDRAEMLREREQAEKLLGKEIARINRMAKNARWVDSYRKDGTLSRKQIRVMENLASKLGLKIELHETMAENGLYDPKTRTIHIALDAQNPIDAVFGHETMHKIAENEEDYEMMRNLAIEILGEEEFNRRADKAEELYKDNGYDYDRAYYEQEVVCDFMGDMLHDNELLERVSWNANHRVLSAIRDVLDRIISGLGLVDENLVRVRTVISAAYNNAIRRAEQNKEDVTVEEERKASHRRKEEVDAKSRAYFEANKTGLTEQEYAEGQAMMDRMASMMNPYIDATAKGRRILPEERYGGKDAESTIFSNGSYGKSMENTLICLRTLAYNEFVNAVKRELGRPITQQESFLASQMVYDIATDPQCLYCYVSLDRKAYDEFLLRYMTQRDEVLNKFRALSEDEKNIGKKNPNEALAELYKEYLNGRKDTKEQKNRFNMWIRNEIAGIKTITTADLATSEDRENILNGLDEALAAQVKDAEKYAKSAAWAKKEVDYISYVGELLKLSKNWVNKLTSEYGLRFYSFSEYTPAFLLENMQMVRDAALRGLRGLGYTKEIDFVKVFAPTGMNINCSCYGRLDKDGNMQMDNLQGADWNEVKELRKKYKNVGAVFVATNDAAVEWALAQDWIDVVIPFHIVRTGQDIADFYGWTNYSSEQADKAKQGQRKMYISPVEHKNDKETFLAACEKHNVTPRFAKWLDNPGYMKLVNETRLSVDESVPLKPVFDMEAAEDSWTRFVNKGGYYNGWWQVDEEGLLKAIQRVVEDIKAGKKANEVEYGNQKMPVNVDKMAKEARKKRMHGQAPIMDVFDKYGNVIPSKEIRASVRKGTNAPEMTDEEEEIITKAKENGTYMKAPNGEQSNLSPRQWVQVRTEAFKKWFGDWENDPANASKVVDENGEPRVVYHQTNSTVYVNKETGENYDNLSWEEKDYWKNEASEEEWENTWEERNFYVFDNKTHGRRSVEMPAFFFSPEYDEYHEYGDRTIAAFLNLRNPIVNPDIPNRGVTDTAGEDAMNSYIEQGYDGFIREYDGKVDEINAFFPNQIKSADDNIGTFDGNNPDVRYSLRKGTDVPGMTDEERALRYEGDSDIRFSIRTEPDPKRTIKVYKLMRLGEDGKLYPLFIGNTEEIVPGTWYNADSPALKDLKSLPADTYNSTYTATVDGAKVKKEYTYASYLVNNETGEAIPISQFIENMKKEGDERFSKMKGIPNADAIRWATENGYRWIKVEDNGNKQTRYGGDTKSYYNYGINGAGSVGKFAMRPGWHAGSLPTMRQIGKGSKKNLRDDNFVWVEGEIPADIDYNDEASKNPDRDIPDRIPKDGYYMKATNADKTKSQAGTVGWYVAGAFKANRVISDDEARSVIDKFNMEHEGQRNGKVEYDYEREGGMPFGEEDAKKVNERLGANMPELTDDIFSQAEEIRDNEQARASLRNNSRGVGLTYTAMQRAWDREMSRASFFAKEGYWDYLASVDEFQKLIARETGREISSMEDTYRAMLSLSSKNANDMKQFDSLLALPLQKAILKLIGATKNYDRGPGRELCDYLMAKHGIERNRDMAVRNALKEKNTDENGLDRAAYGNDLDMYYASVDKVLIDAEQNGYSWRKTEELLDQTAESYGADLSVDYSGLQGMYTDDGADEYVDYQTAKQSAIRDVEYYESIKDKDDLEEMWDAVRAISSYSLVKQSQSGLTNEDYLRDQMRRYRYFVPLRGFAEDTAEEMYDYIDADRTNGGLGSPVKTAKGHQHKSGDPIGNLLNVAYRSIASGNKNMAISHLYNLATTRDTGGILKVSKIWLENKGTKDDPDWVMVTPNLTDPSTGGPEMSGEDVQAELDRFEKEMLRKKEQGLVMQVTDTSVTPPYRIEQKQHNKSHQIRVNVAGRPRIITVVGNPRLAMAMNGLLNPQTSAWKGLSVLNNFLSAAFTSVNPSFGAANLVRDSLHSNMRMFVSESPIYWAKYTAKQKMLVGNAANWAQMLTMLRDYQKGRRPSGQRAQMFKEFMDGGGATGYTMIRNQEESIQFVKDMMKELKKGKTSKVNPMRLFDLFSYANEAAELVNRFLAYETSREMGRTIERSINDAKEATLNFNRKGAGTRSLTDKRGIAYTLANALNYYSQYGRSFLIFFNAFAQGQRQLWEMAKANPGKFTMAFGVVPAVTAGIALPMLNNVLLPAIYSMASGDGDDDEYVDYYDDLSDWERHHNLCIRAGKSWIKIPLSPELSAMYALGDVIGGAVWGKREMSGSDLMVLADLMVPNNVDTSQPKVTASAYAPSAVRPLVNVGINMDFRGRPISKDGSYNKYSPAWRKATRSTSKSLTALSRALNAASGGSDERQGVLDVSPGYVQEMMTGLAGGYMSTTLAVSDALLPVHLAGGGTEQSFAAGAKALWDRGGVPIISRFYVPGSGERKTSRAKSQYYETVVPMMQQVQSEYTLIRGITREAKQDMVRADARLKDAQASGDTIAIAEALQGKERAEQALREAALERETKTKELMSSGRWRAYTEMLGLTRYVDEMLKVYGQGELPDNVNDAMRSAVEIEKDLDKDD